MSSELGNFSKNFLSQERSRIQEYVYTTCLYIGSESFALMTVKKPWMRSRIHKFAQFKYKSTQLKSRVEEIFQILASFLSKSEIPGSRLEVLYDMDSPVVKISEMPAAKIDLIMSAVALRVPELFPLSYRSMSFSFSRFPGKAVNQSQIMIHGVPSQGIEAFKELELRLPGRRRLNRFTPLVRSALKICLDYQLEDSSSKLWIIELESRICFVTVQDQTIATINYEEDSFYDTKGKFDPLKWRVFLRSRYKTIVYQNLDTDFPTKIEIEKVFFLSSKSLFNDLKKDLELQHNLASFYYVLDEQKVKTPEEFDTSLKALMWAQCELKLELEQMDSNYLEAQKLDTKGLILFKYLTRHFKLSLVAVLVLANAYYSYRINQARDMASTLSTELKSERQRLAEVDALYTEIQGLNLEQSRVQKILMSKVHPTIWYERVQQFLPDACRIQGLKVQRGTVEMEGDAASYEDIIQFTSQVSKESDVEEMNLEYVNLNTDGRFNFRVVYYWDSTRLGTQKGS